MEIVNNMVFKPNYPTKILNGKKVIDYEAWVKRIALNWPPKKKREIKRDLCRIFS